MIKLTHLCPLALLCGCSALPSKQGESGAPGHVEERWEVTAEAADDGALFTIDSRNVMWALYERHEGSVVAWKGSRGAGSVALNLFGLPILDLVADAHGASVVGLKPGKRSYEVILRDQLDKPSPKGDVVLGSLPYPDYEARGGTPVQTYGVDATIDAHGTRHACAHVGLVIDDLSNLTEDDRAAQERGYLAWASYDGEHVEWQEFAASASACSIAVSPEGRVWISASSRGHIVLFARSLTHDWSRTDIGEGHDPQIAIDPRTHAPVVVWSDCVRADMEIHGLPSGVATKAWSLCRGANLHLIRDASRAHPLSELLPAHGGLPRIAIGGDDHLTVVYSTPTGSEDAPTWTQQMIESTSLEQTKLSFDAPRASPGQTLVTDARGHIAFGHAAHGKLTIIHQSDDSLR